MLIYITGRRAKGLLSPDSQESSRRYIMPISLHQGLLVRGAGNMVLRKGIRKERPSCLARG